MPSKFSQSFEGHLDANNEVPIQQFCVFNPEDLDSEVDILLDETAALSRRDLIIYLLKRESFGFSEVLTEKFSFFLVWLISDSNPILRFWAAAFGFGLDITQGISQSQKAADLDVTRAAISKRVKQFQSEFGSISRNMKSQRACNSYQQDKKTNHHRYQKIYKEIKNDNKCPNDSN